MKYQMFITTCLKSQVNGLNRILIDIHEENPDYLGDGVFASQASSFMYPKTPFQEAVKRYGTDAFVKSILFESNYYEEVNNKFKEFVTHSLVKLSHIYNWNVNQTYPILYQFDQNGNFIKKLEKSSTIGLKTVFGLMKSFASGIQINTKATSLNLNDMITQAQKEDEEIEEYIRNEECLWEKVNKFEKKFSKISSSCNAFC